MRTLVWSLGWIIVALWSLTAWTAHGLVGVAGSLTAGNADLLPLDPEGVVLISGLAGWLTEFGQGTVVVAWALVTLLILGLTSLLARLIGRPPQAAPADRR